MHVIKYIIRIHIYICIKYIYIYVLNIYIYVYMYTHLFMDNRSGASYFLCSTEAVERITKIHTCRVPIPEYLPMPALVDPGISSKQINMQCVYRQQQNDIDICDMHIN